MSFNGIIINNKTLSLSTENKILVDGVESTVLSTEISVDDTNFISNLSIGDNTVQKIADKLDTLPVSEENMTLQSTNYTALSFDYISCDTLTNGVWTLTLPATPSNYDKVWVVDIKGSFSDNNLIVSRNTNLIMGLVEDMICDVSNDKFGLLFINGDWRII